jgi:hypothetical protein
MSAPGRATEDCGRHYEQLRTDLIGLVRSRPAADRRRRVPATPAWTVVDVVGHVAGLCRDLNHQQFPAGSTEDWTDAQVRRARGLGFDAVAAEWDAEAPEFEQGLRDFGYPTGSHFVGDLFVHTTDVRVALDAPVDRTSTTMRIALDFYLDTLHDDLAPTAGALLVRLGDEHRVLGTGAITATVTAEPFEMLRACAGRRTLAEIRAFDWDGDAASFAARISRYETPTSTVGA